MSNMDLQQSLRSIVPAAVLAGFVFEPFWFGGCLLLLWWARKRYDDSLLFKIASGINVVNLLLMLIPQEVSFLEGTSVPTLITWLFGYSPIRMMVPALVLLMLLYTDILRPATPPDVEPHRVAGRDSGQGAGGGGHQFGHAAPGLHKKHILTRHNSGDDIHVGPILDQTSFEIGYTHQEVALVFCQLVKRRDSLSGGDVIDPLEQLFFNVLVIHDLYSF